eukprot:TRINITY_DN5389_c0_g1_i4.p1 TRINITY_DN5389_c0_g1~~TRINITY_DN5389_c0_g1_i4.p1  ORF type:complete len:1608 (-),score=224.72 TRINITY_DN5389_c0_g1_i4:56-4879(-)
MASSELVAAELPVQNVGTTPATLQLKARLYSEDLVYKPLPKDGHYPVTVCVDVKSIQSGLSDERWHTLQAVSTGEVLVRLEMPEPFDFGKQADWSQERTVVVGVRKGRNLEAHDTDMLGRPLSDPYVILRVGDTEKARTRIIPKTLNPSWEETIEVKVRANDRFLRLEAFDNNRTKADEPLGWVEVPLFGLNSTCSIFVVDASGAYNLGSETDKGGVAKQLVSSTISSAPFTEHDWVGILHFTASSPPVVHLTRMNAAGKASVLKQIEDLKMVGGTGVTDGVISALDALGQWNENLGVATHHIYVITDGCDATSVLHSSNWERLHLVGNRLRSLGRDSEKRVVVHGFAIGKEADKYLVEALARHGGGDYAYGHNDSAGLDRLRIWLHKHLGAQFLSSATNLSLRVDCQDGVTVHRVGTYPILPNVEQLGYLRERAPTESGKHHLPDISCGASYHVLVQLRVAPGAVKRFGFDAAKFTLEYCDARLLMHRNAESVARVVPDTALVDRQHHFYLAQAFVLRGHGPAAAFNAEGESVFLAPGQWLEVGDSVTVDLGGEVVLRFVDNSEAVIEGPAEITIRGVQGGKNEPGVQLELLRGSVVARSAQAARMLVRVAGYELLTQTHSWLHVSLDPVKAQFRCFFGEVAVWKVPESNSRIRLTQFTQCTARNGNNPSSPIAMDMPAFELWARHYPESAIELAHVQHHCCRIVAAEHILLSVALMAKGGGGRSAEVKQNRRCRRFLIRHFVQEARKFLGNSVSAALPQSVLVRQQLEWVLGRVEAQLEYGKAIVYDIADLARSLRDERPRGNCSAFLTEAQSEFIGLTETPAQRLARVSSRWSEAKDHEQLRREEQIAHLFPKWDLDASKFIEFAELQQVILSFTMPRGGEQPREQKLLDRWYGLVNDQPMAMALDVDQLTILLLYLTDDYEADEFDLLIQHIEETLRNVNQLTEGTRKMRAVLNLFQLWDEAGQGFVTAADIVERLQSIPAFADDDELQRLEQAIAESAREETGTLTCPEPELDKVKVYRFWKIFDSLLSDCNDFEYHDALVLIREHLEAERSKTINTLQKAAVEHERVTMRDQIVQWDLRHSLDGVTYRDVDQFLHIDPPPFIQRVCMPICVLASISPKRPEASDVAHRIRAFRDNEDTLDYWTPLRAEVERDWYGFLNSLRNLPTMSITRKQLQQLERPVADPVFDALAVYPVSKLLSLLVDWAKVVLKIVLLNREIVFAEDSVISASSPTRGSPNKYAKTGGSPPRSATSLRMSLESKADLTDVLHLLPRSPEETKKRAVLDKLRAATPLTPATPDTGNGGSGSRKSIKRPQTASRYPALTTPRGLSNSSAGPSGGAVVLPSPYASISVGSMSAVTLPRSSFTPRHTTASAYSRSTAENNSFVRGRSSCSSARSARSDSSSPPRSVTSSNFSSSVVPTPSSARPSKSARSTKRPSPPSRSEHPTGDSAPRQPATIHGPSEIIKTTEPAPPMPVTIPTMRPHPPSNDHAPVFPTTAAETVAGSPLKATRMLGNTSGRPQTRRLTQVERWLETHSLEEYIAPMHEHGFDDMSELVELLTDHNDLFESLVPKVGHRRKMQRLLGFADKKPVPEQTEQRERRES